MSKKNICFVVSAVITARFFLRYHIEILSNNYNVYLVGNFSPEDIESLRTYKLMGIKSIPIQRKINLISDIKALALLFVYFKKMRFEIIHSLAPKAGLIAAAAGLLAGTKNRVHIFTGQVWHTKTGIYKFILKTIDKLIVMLTTNILVDGESQKQYLISKKVINNKNSYVLGKGSISGVDIKRFYPTNCLREKLRKELNLDNDSIIYIYMGRLNEDKGVLDLAYAFKMLKDKLSKAILLVVGYDEADYALKMEKIVGDKNKFIFYGPTLKPEEIIQVGDVFCLPSYREGFGTSVIEASSCKLAIICSDTYGLEETIIDGQTGLRHKVGDIDDLFKKMLILASDSELREKLGENGYKYVIKHFTAEKISQKWLEFYLTLN